MHVSFRPFRMMATAPRSQSALGLLLTSDGNGWRVARRKRAYYCSRVREGIRFFEPSYLIGCFGTPRPSATLLAIFGDLLSISFDRACAHRRKAGSRQETFLRV